MPLYVYGCPRCDVLIEELRPSELADFPPVECPVCHGLCQREMTTVNVLRERRPAYAAANDDAMAPEATSLTFPHLPDCPCCGPRAARQR
jgi:putative FmdB family regulatory protein